MVRREKINATALSLALVVSLIAAVTVLGAAVGSVGAVHPSDAPDLTDEANFTVNFPNAEDHYPDREEEGSIEYFASGADAFAVQDAEEGVYIDWIIVHAEYEGEDWIDYSACSTDNTKAFGIDRGNNNSGTNYDQDLIQHRKDDEFRDDGIVVEFYDWKDIGDPPYLAPEDAIVAAQGEGSVAGPCLTLTDEPGWYRIAGFMNGTVADNGPDEQPSDSAEHVSLELNSNFLYVCECDSREEAEEELGPAPPDREGTPTPTAEPGDDDGSTDDDGNADDDGSTDDDGNADDDGTTDDDGSADDDGTTDDNGGADDDGSTDDDGSADDDGSTDDGNGGTPAADGPGFGALAALVALLASALLLYRRH